MKNEIRMAEFQDTVDSIDTISRMMQDLSDEGNLQIDQMFMVDYSMGTATATVFPESEQAMTVCLGEYVYVGGGAVKILSKQDVEKIQKIG